MEMLLDITIKWAIPFLLGTISTALISYVKSKYSKDRKKEIAIENNCTDMYLAVNEENKRAIKCYEKFGFKVKQISYSMNL